MVVRETLCLTNISLNLPLFAIARENNDSIPSQGGFHCNPEESNETKDQGFIISLIFSGLNLIKYEFGCFIQNTKIIIDQNKCIHRY